MPEEEIEKHIKDVRKNPLTKLTSEEYDRDWEELEKTIIRALRALREYGQKEYERGNLTEDGYPKSEQGSFNRRIETERWDIKDLKKNLNEFVEKYDLNFKYTLENLSHFSTDEIMGLLETAYNAKLWELTNEKRI